MKKIIISILLILPMYLLAQLSVISDLSYDLGHKSYITGIDTIIIFEKIDSSASLKYSFSDSTRAEWLYHPRSSEPTIVEAVNTDTVTILEQLKTGLYELRTNNTTSHYFYILDFSKYQNIIDSVWVDDSYDCCQSITLNAILNSEDIVVYDKINDSTHLIIPAENSFLWLTDTAEFQGNSKNTIDAPFSNISYGCIPHSANFFDNNLNVRYPKTDTIYTDEYKAVAIELSSFTYTIADHEDGYLSNESESSTPTKGSAPLDVTYNIEHQGNIDYTGWWIWEAAQKQPNSPTYRNIDQMVYTFEKFVASPGYRVKVVISNDSCSAKDSVDVMVTESMIKVPNILVLGWGSIGIFKVAYQSIDPSSFRATIYDRKGRLMYKWNDPDQGWDGRTPITGGYVSPGAYFYSIRARGTDGENYELIGDVNVIREKGIK